MTVIGMALISSDKSKRSVELTKIPDMPFKRADAIIKEITPEDR